MPTPRLCSTQVDEVTRNQSVATLPVKGVGEHRVDEVTKIQSLATPQVKGMGEHRDPIRGEGEHQVDEVTKTQPIINDEVTKTQSITETMLDLRGHTLMPRLHSNQFVITPPLRVVGEHQDPVK